MDKDPRYWLLWLVFPLYALVASLWLVPSDDASTQMVQQLITGDLTSIEPLVFVIFNSLGVLPMIFAMFFLFDGKEQSIPAWPFVLLSFVTGAAGALLYLAIRKKGLRFSGEKTRLMKILDNPIAGIILLLTSLGLLIYGIIYGDFSNYIEIWQSINFVHVMTFDFLILNISVPILIKEDMFRRDCYDKNKWILYSVIPVFGTIMYLIMRPKLST